MKDSDIKNRPEGLDSKFIEYYGGSNSPDSDLRQFKDTQKATNIHKHLKDLAKKALVSIFIDLYYVIEINNKYMISDNIFY